MFLGRSKSEQYFGLFPFFTYINFILGYIPIISNDLTSQIIIIIYTVYNIVVIYIRNTINNFFKTSFIKLSRHYKLKKTEHLITRTTVNNRLRFSSFSKKPSYSYNNYTTILSKYLSKLSNDIYLINNIKLLNFNLYKPNHLQINKPLLYKTLKINSKDNKTYNYTLLTTSEAFYTNLNSKNNFKFKTTQTNINTIYKISNFTKNLNFFNFNIDKNLKISKQKRWLIRNSLLSESMVPNSYLITQSKKLIGNGLLNKDFSSKTLWLPTIMSKLSSLESNIHVKNLQHQLFQTNSDSTLSINNQLIHPYFLNLNFFENSRV